LSTGLSLVAFDATDRGLFAGASGGSDGTSRRTLGLSPVWHTGALFFGALGGVDAWAGVSSWTEALTWATRMTDERGKPIRSLELWGHGGWGSMQMGPTRLDREALGRTHALAPALDAIAERLEPSGLFWLRCCSAFGGRGRRFAEDLALRLRVRVAGHTYVIHALQSGLHKLDPGERADWDEREGVRFEDGIAKGALSSTFGAPRTVSCFARRLPSWA
jgi:hypothetical protein